MRFVFSPPAGEVAGLLTLPWAQPLEDWQDQRLVEIRQRGISRHIVRFVEDSGELYALKSISEMLARRHRWYMSEAASRDVGTTAAARSYFDTVLPAVPQPLSTQVDA